MHYKILDSCLSGTEIDMTQTPPAIYPNTKASIHVRRDIVGKGVIVWNSLGEKKYATQGV